MHKRITFYTGFLDTPSTGPLCGEWTPSAMQKTQEELSIPFKTILVAGIKNLSLQKIADTVECKCKKYIFEYSQSGLTWLEGHMTNGWTETRNYGRYWIELKNIEYFSSQALKLISFSLIMILVYNIKKLKTSEIVVLGLTLLTIFMFFTIHTFLEIQPRYIIPPVLISLVFSLYLHSRMLKDV